MKSRILFPLLLAGALAVPATSNARSWYQEGWFIGSAAALGGGIVGYVIGKEAGRERHRPHYSHYHYPPRADYVTINETAPVHMTGAYYVRDKRAFPFYRKTEIYPIASTMPRVYRPQAVSVAESPWYAPRTRQPYEYADVQGDNSPRDIVINIGDNNENVNITLHGAERREPASAEPKVPVANQEESLPGRVVDQPVSKVEKSPQ